MDCINWRLAPREIRRDQDTKFIEMDEQEEIKHSEEPDPPIIECQSEIVPQFDVDSLGGYADAISKNEGEGNINETLRRNKLMLTQAYTIYRTKMKMTMVQQPRQPSTR